MKQSAIYREIWEDDRFCSLDNQEKLFAVYLATNPNLSLIPVFRLSEREISYDLGFLSHEISKYLINLEKIRIYYRFGHVIIDNEFKPFSFNSKQLTKASNSLWKQIPRNVIQVIESDRLLIGYRWPIDSSSSSNSNNSSNSSSKSREIENIKEYDEIDVEEIERALLGR